MRNPRLKSWAIVGRPAGTICVGIEHSRVLLLQTHNAIAILGFLASLPGCSAFVTPGSGGRSERPPATFCQPSGLGIAGEPGDLTFLPFKAKTWDRIGFRAFPTAPSALRRTIVYGDAPLGSKHGRGLLLQTHNAIAILGFLASLRENGAYIVPKTFLPSRLRRGGWGIVSNRTCRLKRCISFRVACNWRHCAMAWANHSKCSLDKATLTVLPLTLRVH